MITSISIPNHSTNSSGGAHVTYEITINDDKEGTYTISKRYQEFTSLNSALSKKANPPEPLPKSRSLWKQELHHLINPFTAFLDDEFLTDRKGGLEKYLNGIAFGKNNTIWTNSQEWKDFVQKPKAPTPGKQESPDAAKGVPLKGVNSYYLHTIQETDRTSILDAIQKAGFTVIRIFISHITANNKGSNNAECPDLEPEKVGTYNDTVLELIDQLMVECNARKLKLIIGCHARYSLGWWDTDVYATTYGVAKPGSSGAQEITDASKFYSNQDAKRHIDLRIDHILDHKNAKMDNQRWGDLGDVIYAVEPENEPAGYMKDPQTAWIQDRAGRVREGIGSKSGIKVSNGGGVTISASLTDSMINMKNVDILCVHDYGTDPWSSVANVGGALSKVKDAGKTLLFEEWGATGGNKNDLIYAYVEALYDYDIAWCFWQVTIPTKGTSDFEVAPNDDFWDSLTHKPTGTRKVPSDQASPQASSS